MTRNWIAYTLASLASVALAFSSTATFADEPEALPEPPAAESTENEPDEPQLEVDEGEDGGLNAQLEKAVEEELGESVKENTAEELLNLAMELKLSAQNLVDLTKIVSLCNKAEKLGLDPENLEFAKQLRVSARLDRGLALAQIFMNPDLKVDQLPNDWRQLRNNVIGDLKAGLAENPDMPIANLALGRLYMLADRFDDAKKTLELAVNGEDADNDVKVLALIFRASLENSAKTAIPFIEQALAVDPDGNARLHSQYSQYLQQSGRKDEALKEVDRAIEISEKDASNESAAETASYKKEKALLLAEIDRVDEARANWIRFYERLGFSQYGVVTKSRRRASTEYGGRQFEMADAGSENSAPDPRWSDEMVWCFPAGVRAGAAAVDVPEPTGRGQLESRHLL